jgi:hypothetical protein
MDNGVTRCSTTMQLLLPKTSICSKTWNGDGWMSRTAAMKASRQCGSASASLRAVRAR